MRDKLVNDYIESLEPYSLTSHKIWDISDSLLHSVLKLDWNEATIPPTPMVNKRISKLVKNDRYNWYPNCNNDTLVNLLSNYTQLDAKNIQYFGSSDSLHEYVIRTFIKENDNVIILGPTYDNFRLTCEAQGAKVNYYFYDKSISIDYNDFEFFIRNNPSKLVYLCNPNNPTGAIHSIKNIERLVSLFPSIIFLIDEAYYEFNGVTCSDLIEKFENIVISRTFSKAFALANFRIGYLLAPIDIIDNVSKIRNPKNISSFAQEAAIAALEDIPYMTDYVAEVLLSRKDFAENVAVSLKQVAKVYNGGGNFVFIEFFKESEKTRFIEFLESNFIFIRNLSYTYYKGFFARITIGTRLQMKRVSEIIESFYER